MINHEILQSKEHPRKLVEGPFATFPCECDTDSLIVHITNGETMGDDLVECPECRVMLSFGDLYAGLKMPLADKS
jgi:hypothetical protein